MITKCLKILFLIGILFFQFSFEISAQGSTSLKTRTQFEKGIFRKSEKYIQKSHLTHAQKEKLTESLKKTMKDILNQSGISDTSLKGLEEQVRQKKFNKILKLIEAKIKTVDPNDLKKAFEDVKPSDFRGGLKLPIRIPTSVYTDLSMSRYQKRKIEKEVEKYSSMITHKETTMIIVSKYENANLLICYNIKDKKTIKFELIDQTKPIEYFKENKQFFDRELKDKYILMPDNGLLNKQEFQKIFNDRPVFWLKKDQQNQEMKRNKKEYQNKQKNIDNSKKVRQKRDEIKKWDELKNFKRSRNNFNRLKTTIISKEDIEIFNLLPKNKDQGDKMGLKEWSSIDISSTQNNINNVLKENGLLQNLSKYNSKKNRLFRKKNNKKENIFKLLTENKGKTKVIFFVAHVSSNNIMLPSGEKVSPKDFKKLSHDAFDKTIVIPLGCKIGLENKTDSFANEILNKGAIHFLAPPYSLETAELSKIIKTISQSAKNKQNGLQLIEALNKITQGRFIKISEIIIKRMLNS